MISHTKFKLIFSLLGATLARAANASIYKKSQWPYLQSSFGLVKFWTLAIKNALF